MSVRGFVVVVIACGVCAPAQAEDFQVSVGGSAGLAFVPNTLTVQVGDTVGATQFLFTDPGISIPSGRQNVVIFAGYDEGPTGR